MAKHSTHGEPQGIETAWGFIPFDLDSEDIGEFAMWLMIRSRGVCVHRGIFVKHDDTGHWEWTGKGRTGKFCEYGAVRLNGKMMSSHRAVWILVKGYIPGDLLHQCDMKLCCNPDHLREGTHQENLKEAVAARGKGWGFCSPEFKASKLRKKKCAT